jgi:hypothetical protein
MKAGAKATEGADLFVGAMATCAYTTARAALALEANDEFG